jgi:pimeloyl-ACP methyl ester carboxylesterase
LLGFGLSDKPLVDYTAEVWRDQAVDFIQAIIQKPTTVAGNSLGGFTALYTSTAEEVKGMINGCVLLNGAGRFRDPTAPLEPDTPNYFTQRIKAAFQRLVIGASFVYTKQPARIDQVLRQVYPVSSDMVDEELVQSILYPSLHPNAAEVFYRVITKNGSGPQVFVDDLLERLDCPLLLCWGEEDPWIKPAAADKIQALYPASQRVSIDAGHCPHDEAPVAVNAAIQSFMKTVLAD